MSSRSTSIRLLVAIAAVTIPLGARTVASDDCERSIKQFLQQEDKQSPYKAVRRLEAVNGERKGWVEAVTEFSPAAGFSYQVTSEGGSRFIRAKILRAILDAEREIIARGDTARVALAPTNYVFRANGVDADGLANVLMSPRRTEPVLVAGTMFLRAEGGDLVRLEGRLVKSPSFWVKNVDIVRSYERIDGVVLPVTLDSSAELRMFGPATLHMTWTYVEIDGRPVTASTSFR